ncbi:hypothetical protein QP166_08385 [Sphingomonas sp. LR60]|uniref:hypothetical protein n=1 Tax=Sphingomonas sp. LR60 TaxID=3050233 RepID=UPI002FE05B28
MIAFLVLASLAGPTCAVERAHYALRHHPEVTAAFHPVESGADWPARVALTVRNAEAKTTSWWLPWDGGSNGLQNIASTDDPNAPGWHPPSPDGGPRPHGDREFIGMDAQYLVLSAAPKRGARAPAHFMLPASGGSQDDVFRIRQFFDLVGCTPCHDRQ